jgi:Zn-dependent protease
MNLEHGLRTWLPYVPAFLLSLSVHESAHALVAKLCGDDTAARQGRISLYPPRHMEIFGTLILPILSVVSLGMFYGYAKPTPVNPERLRQPKRDFSLVALAGPGSNFALALLSALAGRALLPFAPSAGPLIVVCSASVELNLLLGLINILPLPGFDGLKALYVFFPDNWGYRLNQMDRGSILILLLVSMVGGLAWLGMLLEILLHLSNSWLGFPL